MYFLLYQLTKQDLIDKKIIGHLQAARSPRSGTWPMKVQNIVVFMVSVVKASLVLLNSKKLLVRDSTALALACTCTFIEILL